MTMTTGAILKGARERLGLNQKEVAKRALGSDEHQSLVSRYEADVVEPSLVTLRKLAPVLELSLGDFDLQPADYTDVSIPPESTHA